MQEKSQAKPKDVTTLLAGASGGDRSAIEALLPLVYQELRALAAAVFKDERGDHTLQPTALVHEAYVKLVHYPPGQLANRKHFFAVAAKAMRQVLADHARGKRAQKRGEGRRQITLIDSRAEGGRADLDLLAVDEALTTLAQLNARHARIVELRFLAGLTIDEVAEVLEVSRRTVELDWRMARAWLQNALSDK